MDIQTAYEIEAKLHVVSVDADKADGETHRLETPSIETPGAIWNGDDTKPEIKRSPIKKKD